MSEAASKLMGIPQSKLKMDDPRVGLTPEQIAAWKALHPDPTYADIPTSQEVADGVSVPDEDDTDPDLTAPVTEETRLKNLLSSFAKMILEYFSAKK